MEVGRGECFFFFSSYLNTLGRDCMVYRSFDPTCLVAMSFEPQTACKLLHTLPQHLLECSAVVSGLCDHLSSEGCVELVLLPLQYASLLLIFTIFL